MSGAPHFKSLGLRVKSAGAPDEAQLAKIREYTLADLPAEKLYVRTFVVAHNAIDRDNECFGADVLAAFAQSLPGKGLHIKHPLGWDGDTGPGKGRWFEAELVRMSHEEARKLLREPNLVWPPGEPDAVLLQGSAFLAVTTGNADLRDEIDAGIAGDVSIGFTAKWPEPVIDADGHELTVRKWGLPADALEASLVWLGAQPGARGIKSAKTPESNQVNLEEQLKAANTRKGELENQLAESEKTASRLTAARKALGDDAHILETDEVLVETVAAAKAHREQLVDQIVAAERAHGVCGDDDEAVKAAKAIYAGEKLPRLEALAKHWAQRTPTGSKVAPTEPNQNRRNAPEAKDAFSTNPAFGGTATAQA